MTSFLAKPFRREATLLRDFKHVDVTAYNHEKPKIDDEMRRREKYTKALIVANMGLAVPSVPLVYNLDPPLWPVMTLFVSMFSGLLGFLTCFLVVTSRHTLHPADSLYSPAGARGFRYKGISGYSYCLFVARRDNRHQKFYLVIAAAFASAAGTGSIVGTTFASIESGAGGTGSFWSTPAMWATSIPLIALGWVTFDRLGRQPNPSVNEMIENAVIKEL